MPAHPFQDVAIIGVHNTKQELGIASSIDSVDALLIETALGAVADADVPLDLVDGIISYEDTDLPRQLRLAPAWRSRMQDGIPAVLSAATAINAGLASCVLITASPEVSDGATPGSTAPWTRPDAEIDSLYGLYTAAQYAMIAARHMHRFGTPPEALASVAATIRNNGMLHPLAACFERGPHTVEDVLASRMIADPYHLLDCAIVSTGAAGLLVARRDIALEAGHDPVYVLGAGGENRGAWYRRPPIGFDPPDDDRPDLVDGWLGQRAAERAWKMSGLTSADVDVCELYDPFSFEVIRQLEAFGICPKGEGGDYVLDGGISLDGSCPCNTDGGLLSFSHPGSTVQLLQRIIRGTEQLRGECGPLQVEGAEVALCSNSSSGALFGGVMLLGTERPS